MPVLGCFFPSSPSLDAEARQAAGGALHYQECHGRRAPHLHDDERHGERHGQLPSPRPMLAHRAAVHDDARAAEPRETDEPRRRDALAGAEVEQVHVAWVAVTPHRAGGG